MLVPLECRFAVIVLLHSLRRRRRHCLHQLSFHWRGVLHHRQGFEYIIG
jgi:hypothetical protein